MWCMTITIVILHHSCAQLCNWIDTTKQYTISGWVIYRYNACVGFSYWCSTVFSRKSRVMRDWEEEFNVGFSHAIKVGEIWGKLERWGRDLTRASFCPAAPAPWLLLPLWACLRRPPLPASSYRSIYFHSPTLPISLLLHFTHEGEKKRENKKMSIYIYIYIK